MTFPARYSGPCVRDCGHLIQPGDLIRSEGWSEGFEHAVCPADDLAVVRPPCGSCFQVPATNGTCGCD